MFVSIGHQTTAWPAAVENIDPTNVSPQPYLAAGMSVDPQTNRTASSRLWYRKPAIVLLAWMTRSVKYASTSGATVKTARWRLQIGFRSTRDANSSSCSTTRQATRPMFLQPQERVVLSASWRSKRSWIAGNYRVLFELDPVGKYRAINPDAEPGKCGPRAADYGRRPAHCRAA